MDGGTNWRPTQGADPNAAALAGSNKSEGAGEAAESLRWKAMDGGANWRPTQGADPNAATPAGSGWRTQLQPEARHRIVNKIMETLKKHLPVTVPEGLTELHKIAVRFEETIYNAATSQSDYLRKISLKMLSMESQTKNQQNPGNAQVIPNQNPPGQAPGLPPQGSNLAQSPAIPLMSQQQTQWPNAYTSVQGSLPTLGQNLSSVSQTWSLQNLSGMPQNTMNNGLAQGTPQDMYAAQRQMAGRQQQQAHKQLIYQQQKLLMNRKLQQNSLMMSQFQSQPSQVQQQLGMQQRLQTSDGMLLQQNNIDQQKQYVQAEGPPRSTQ